MIDSKEAIETMLLNLARLEGTDAIRHQLRQVHQHLESLHDDWRSQVEAHHTTADD
ncbi:MAG: hypothetical protein ACON4T_00455 [Synechococcus sp.]